MNVGELIRELEKCPEDMDVQLCVHYDNCIHVQELDHVTVFESTIFKDSKGWVDLNGSKFK